MTGILPIKKDESQSAISEFDEFSMLEPSEFARFTGFTEDEVRLEFEQFLSQKKANKGWMSLITRSQKLLNDTAAGRGDEVAAALNEIREEQYAPQFYN